MKVNSYHMNCEAEDHGFSAVSPLKNSVTLNF